MLSPTPLQKAFFAEQAMIIALSVGLTVMFVLQLISERHLPRKQKVTYHSIKYWFHRFGLLVSLVLLTLSVDPFQVHHIYSSGIAVFVGANVSTVLLWCGIVFDHVAVRAAAMSQFPPAPLPGWLHYAWFAIGFVSTVFCNVVYAVAYVHNRWWYTSAYTAWFAFVVFVIVVVFEIACMRIIQQLDDVAALNRDQRVSSASASSSRRESKVFRRTISESNMRDEDSRRRRMLGRAFFIFLVGGFAIVVNIRETVSRSADKEEPFFAHDTQSFRVLDHLIVYVQLLLAVLLLYFSWIPIQLTRPKYQPVQQQETSRNTFSRNNSTSRNSRTSRSGVNHRPSVSSTMVIADS
eukprot:TRINITY_DN114311_c0_g1_i2.p1 TRINITY_DN114311_c0_g1~~TRINITY_DN114311_c0_g1_i2.p1  ORF type:complete len:350 (-),score=171.97 TRINITY_DN114311_c0_g1_i2:44-1093(-)